MSKSARNRARVKPPSPWRPEAAGGAKRVDIGGVTYLAVNSGPSRQQLRRDIDPLALPDGRPSGKVMARRRKAERARRRARARNRVAA